MNYLISPHLIFSYPSFEKEQVGSFGEFLIVSESLPCPGLT